MAIDQEITRRQAAIHQALAAINERLHHLPPVPGINPLPAMGLSPRYYLMRRATSLAECREQLPQVCSCIRKSFAGVKWRVAGEEFTACWAEVDAQTS